MGAGFGWGPMGATTACRLPSTMARIRTCVIFAGVGRSTAAGELCDSPTTRACGKEPPEVAAGLAAAPLVAAAVFDEAACSDTTVQDAWGNRWAACRFNV